MMNWEKLDYRKIIVTLLSVFGILVSMLVVSPKVESPQFHESTIASIDNKVTTVLQLTAASTAASAAVSAIPDDTATPIADKLADFSTYFMFVLCVLYLEKYLITITAAASFRVLVPAALGCLILWLWSGKKKYFRSIGQKLAALSVCLVLAVPVSVRVSDMIYSTYQTSIHETIDQARDTAEEAEEYTVLSEQDDQQESIIDKAVSWLTTTAVNMTEKAAAVVNNFVECLAVLIVTSCLIPLLVLLFFAWLVKVLFGVDVPVQRRRQLTE